mmetsp:Transcript_14397/g.33496  ORF Transcript_14397/g.33496 Transcript_14397/m.33496 type:complete len:580 (+) Transcript_14397:236-1975(+)
MMKRKANFLAQETTNESLGKNSSSFSIGPGRKLIKELNDNDVLQGRGSGSMQNTGNIRFRSLVEKLRPAYVATSSRKEKAKMIGDMVQLIQSRKGRFLQRLCDKEVEKLGLDPQSSEHHREQEHYIEMTDDEAAEKAKQAIRYVHYKKVPLEEERRKKRAADNSFPPNSSATANDKTKNEASHMVDYSGNSLSSASIPANITNQLVQSQVHQTNIGADVTIPSPLQQTELNQLLATLQSLQSTQNNLPARMAGSVYSTPQSTVPQSSPNLDSSQQASVLQQTTGGMIPMIGSVKQNPNTLQELASSLFPNNNSPSTQTINHTPSAFLSNSINQNSSQQQLPQQQTQLNILLQSLLQQQTTSQPNSIIQTILQQKQHQQQLNSAIQTLQQQQHQLTSTIQSFRQPQQLSTDPQFQQQLQQQKSNSILASLLSSVNTNPQVSSPADSLTTQPNIDVNLTAAKTQSTIDATSALLTSFLSSNVSQRSTFHHGTSSHVEAGKSSGLLGGLLSSRNMNDANIVVTPAGQQQQQNEGLLGTNSIQTIPGLAQNVNLFFANNANKNAPNQTNISKRSKISMENQVV